MAGPSKLAQSMVDSLTYCVGIDIGRSGVKIVIGRQVGARMTYREIIISPYACRATDLVDASQAVSAERHTVCLADGSRWWYGDAVEVFGEKNDGGGNFADWSLQPDYEALIAASFKEIALVVESPRAPVAVVGGLPAGAADEARNAMAALFLRYAPEGSRARVLIQPVGAYFAARSGAPEIGGANVNTVILDGGRYSTDLAATASGALRRNAAVSVEGSRKIVELLAAKLTPRAEFAQLPSFDKLEGALYNGGQIRGIRLRTHDVQKEVAAAVAEYATYIIREVELFLARIKGEADYLVLAGGTGALIQEHLNKHYPSILAPGGRLAVARGFAILAANLKG